MNIPIQQYLPHRAPMQMVDTITNISSTHVVTEFTISSSCIFVAKGVFAEIGLIENMAQTCSAIVGQFIYEQHEQPNLIGYISTIKKSEIYKLPIEGQTIRTEATLLSQIDTEDYTLCAMKCSTYEQTTLLATAELNLVIKNLSL